MLRCLLPWDLIYKKLKFCLVKISCKSVYSPPPSAAYMHQWTGSSLVQAPSHCLNQCWLMVNWTPEILIEILSFSFKKIYLKMSSAKVTAILSWGDQLTFQCMIQWRLRSTMPCSISGPQWFNALHILHGFPFSSFNSFLQRDFEHNPEGHFHIKVCEVSMPTNGRTWKPSLF